MFLIFVLSWPLFFARSQNVLHCVCLLDKISIKYKSEERKWGKTSASYCVSEEWGVCSVYIPTCAYVYTALRPENWSPRLKAAESAGCSTAIDAHRAACEYCYGRARLHGGTHNTHATDNSQSTSRKWWKIAVMWEDLVVRGMHEASELSAYLKLINPAAFLKTDLQWRSYELSTVDPNSSECFQHDNH